MDAQLRDCGDQLADAIQTYRRLMYSAGSDAAKEQASTKASILGATARLKRLVCEPTDFLQDVASQTEMVACLGWLCEFQIPACIPLDTSVPIKDVAELTGVPERQLDRVVRLTATYGFLDEPQPGIVAHTPLSAQFIENPSFLDAILFVAGTAAPAALQMAPSTQRSGLARVLSSSERSAYNLAFDTLLSFRATCQERPKILRQWSAYIHHATALQSVDRVVDMLSELSWSNLTGSCVVEVGAPTMSVARCLANRYPNLRLIVQLNSTSSGSAMASLGSFDATGDRSGTEASWDPATADSRITATYCTEGARQNVVDAGAYILHLPMSSSPASVSAQLHDHLSVLQSNGAVMILLTSLLLPELGSLPDPRIEASVRARDLSMLQLANEGGMEMDELLDVIETVRNSSGGLVITKRITSPEGIVVALVVTYQPHAEGSLES